MGRFWLIVWVFFGAITTAPAVADEDTFGLADADRMAIVQAIDSQLQAFQRDDGDGVFSMASPGIRSVFGNAATFMTMVRTGYPSVYRPRQVRFLDIVDYHGRPTQRVFVVGPDGKAVVALYLMERQMDGRWLIDGCVLTRPAQAHNGTDRGPILVAADGRRLARTSVFATLAEAEEMADRTAMVLDRIGPEKAIPVFMDPAGAFFDRDLYVFVLDLEGNLWANGAFPQVIGSNAISAQDSRGRLYVADMIRVAQRDGHGWVSYEWLNPCTGDMTPKVSFVRRVGPLIVGVGAYGTIGASLDYRIGGGVPGASA